MICCAILLVSASLAYFSTIFAIAMAPSWCGIIWVRKSMSGLPVYGAASMFFIMFMSAALNSFVDSEPCWAFWAMAPVAAVARAMMTTSLAAVSMVFSVGGGFSG